MSNDTVIKVEGLGKLYKIGTQAPYHRLSDLLAGVVKTPLNWLKKRPPSEPTSGSVAEATSDAAPPGYFWSLKDINFEVKRGQVVGIIGRNGAGKSTLLKILSRITEPTRGLAQIRGRVGSLLEVGTGFHHELSGRENIYLNGAILGMKKAEIQRKFDEIVAFAEVERFLDSPVKHFSSGMYMRLAFAIAAHLDPEILVLDEVLAVGDIHFQRKCLGKMGEVANSGKTVLFVSHNLAAIRSLCSNVIVLDSGKVAIQGLTDAVLTEYASMTERNESTQFVQLDDITLTQFQVGQQGRSMSEVDGSMPIEVRIDYQINRPLVGFRIGFFLIKPEIGTLTRTLSPDWAPSRETPVPGQYSAKFDVPANFLKAGSYRFLLHASCYGIRDYFATIPVQRTIVVHASTDFNALHPAEPFDAMFIFGQPWRVTQHGDNITGPPSAR